VTPRKIMQRPASDAAKRVADQIKVDQASDIGEFVDLLQKSASLLTDLWPSNSANVFFSGSRAQIKRAYTAASTLIMWRGTLGMASNELKLSKRAAHKLATDSVAQVLGKDASTVQRAVKLGARVEPQLREYVQWIQDTHSRLARRKDAPRKLKGYLETYSSLVARYKGLLTEAVARVAALEVENAALRGKLLQVAVQTNGLAVYSARHRA